MVNGNIPRNGKSSSIVLISHSELSDSFIKLSLDFDKRRRLKHCTAQGGQPTELQLQALEGQRKMLTSLGLNTFQQTINMLNNP